MLSIWLIALTGFITGWLMCLLFTTGKAEDEYWRGYDNGYEHAMKSKYVLKKKNKWQSDYTK